VKSDALAVADKVVRNVRRAAPSRPTYGMVNYIPSVLGHNHAEDGSANLTRVLLRKRGQANFGEQLLEGGLVVQVVESRIGFYLEQAVSVLIVGGP
jgi:hypothetical protein